MKHRLALLLFVLPFSLMGQIDFQKYFTNGSLRVDFELVGNANSELAILQKMQKEPYWGGNPKHTIDVQNKGDYRLVVTNNEGKVLFSRGFNSLFREWQTIGEAKKINRGFQHSVQIPYPIEAVTISIASRQKDNTFKKLLKWDVNPKDYLINREEKSQYKVDTVSYAGNSADYLDLVFVAEGYTKQELSKFKKDVRKFEGWIFNVKPFSDYRKKVNIYAILCDSPESHPDIPGKHVYNRTLLNSSFYTFNSPRYLTVRDTEKMYDIASQVPYDHVYVLVNTDTYGGAGFYNTYTSCASDCRYAREIASHELGHGLVGLADEYYNNGDEVSYYYNLDKEPWEPNLTTLVDFSKKWKNLVVKDTPIPTPREPKYKGELGAFEGGAYQSKGIYSPMQDCKMKSNNTNVLCPACQQAIHQTMREYINK